MNIEIILILAVILLSLFIYFVRKFITSDLNFRKSLLSTSKDLDVRQKKRFLEQEKLREDKLIQQIGMAKKNIGEKNFFGPNEIKLVFGFEISPKNTPLIQFSEEDLIRAAELEQILVLRVNSVKGEPVTMRLLETVCRDRGPTWQSRKPMFLRNKIHDTCLNKIKLGFWVEEETMELSWALSTKNPISQINGDFLVKMDQIVEYLKNSVFKNQTIPPEYQRAIDDFNCKKPMIKDALANSHPQLLEIAENMSLIRLTLPKPIELFYDFLLCWRMHLHSMYDWFDCLTYSDGDKFRFIRTGGSGNNTPIHVEIFDDLFFNEQFFRRTELPTLLIFSRKI